MPDGARADAAASDQRRKSGAAYSVLDGVPVAIKDNIDIAGVPTSGGIEHYRNAVALRDAAIVEQLKAAGAVIVGKTNLHEAALGATTDNPWFGRCDNPRHPGFTPGGSSGGSAAAVAASMCALALGTDTMGSVRIPAAYCAVAGFKPSRGALSLDGVMPLSPTLDHIGLLAVSASDIVVAWRALVPLSAMPASAPGGLRIGVACDLPVREGDADLVALLSDAAAGARVAGYAVSAVSLAGLALNAIRRDAFVLCEIEGAAVHAAAIAANPDGFSPQLRAMLAYGARQTRVVEAGLHQRLHGAATLVRGLCTGIDALLLPTAPQAAFPHGRCVPQDQADFCVLANIAGLPAISIPWGVDGDGLPLGLQVVGAAGQDERVLDIAVRLEASRR